MATGQPPASVLRVLIVSCEFDTAASPQGMRWVELSRELAALGWQVEVLTLDQPRAQHAPGVTVHEIFPGPYRWTLECLRRARVRRSADGEAWAVRTPGSPGRPALNWKGRLEAAIRRASARVLYPDLRREAVVFLAFRLRALLNSQAFDAVIVSHEPPLALLAAGEVIRAGVPLVADLGDPVLACYTPPRWRRRARALEDWVCRHAAGIVVTSEATRCLLVERHAVAAERVEVITQGFRPAPHRPAAQGGAALRVGYTGRFYSFRDPRPALDALSLARHEVVLALAVPDWPEWLDSANPRRIELHGRLAHAESLALQAGADVLLLLGNRDGTQTPGKLYEYLGASRPILYVAADPWDEGARLLVSLRRGIVVPPDPVRIAGALDELAGWKTQGTLDSRFDLSPESVAGFSWRALAEHYADFMIRTRTCHARGVALSSPAEKSLLPHNGAPK